MKKGCECSVGNLDGGGVCVYAGEEGLRCVMRRFGAMDDEEARCV